MHALGAYILSVTAAAMICGIVKTLTNKSGMHSSAVQLLTGIVLVITVLRPVVDLDISPLDRYWDSIRMDAAGAVSTGVEMTKENMEKQIEQKLKQHILSKAESLGLCLEVDVYLDDDSIPKPRAVAIRGDVSPYAKMVLESWITEELGISREAQQWI